MIPQDTIQKIKNQVDIVSYIQSRGVKLTKKNKQYIGLCPFHDDHKPSLVVYPESNRWRCFGCGESGDVITFVMKLNSLNFKEAIARLGGQV